MAVALGKVGITESEALSVTTGRILRKPSNADAVAYDSLSAAIAAASSGDTIVLPTGTYSGDHTIPSGVAIRGEPPPTLSVLTGHITMSANSILRDCLVRAADDGTPAINTSATVCTLVNITLVGLGSSAIGIQNSGTGTIRAQNMIVAGGTFAQSFKNASTGSIDMRGGLALDGSGTTLFDVGAGEMKVYDFINDEALFTNGALISTGTVQLISVDFGEERVTNGIHLTVDGHDVTVVNSRTRASTNDWLVDANLDGTDSNVLVRFSAFRLEKLSFPPAYETGATIRGIFTDEGVQDDPAVRVLSELSVGTWGIPREISVGHGDSTTQGMRVFTYDPTADPGEEYNEITTELSSASGSTAALFAALTTGQKCYIGSELGPFVNMKPTITTAAVLGSGAIAVRYYNGSSFVSIRHMSRDANDDSDGLRKSYDESIFERTGSDHVHLGRVQSSWAATSINSVSAYWLEFEIITASITTAPILERVKLGLDRRELSEDGQEGYGDAEQWKTWISGTGADLSPPSGGVNSPNSFDVSISSSITYREPNSSFPSGSDARHCGKMIRKPVGLDTSRSVRFYLSVDTDGTGTNAVKWRLDVAIVRSGSPVGSLTATQTVNDVVPAGTAATPVDTYWDVDVSAMKEGDFLGFTLYRLGATDTNTDTARFYEWSWAGWFWQ